MQTWLPIFPLQLIVFPGEKMNLHIFESRYKQLVRELHASGGSFAIPPVIEGKMQAVGTIMELREIVRTYPDGRMDITCLGADPCRLQDIQQPCLNKLYDCAKAERMPVQMTGDPIRNQEIINMLSEFYKALNIRKELPPVDSNGLSYRIGHRIGMKPEAEYRLLTEPLEEKRQDLIISHLKTFIPNAKQHVEIRKRALMNGHFRKDGRV